MTDSGPSSFRVLSFVFHTSYSGRVALDGFGLVDRSLLASRLGLRSRSEKFNVLKQLLRRSLRRFRPSVVVLGFSHCDSCTSRVLRDNAINVLRASHVPVVVRPVRDGHSMLCERVRGRRRNQLARAIVSGFLPELAARLPQTDGSDPRLRSLWHAVAVALRELLERFPRAAAALARPAAFRTGRFNTLLARAERRRHPAV